MSKKYTVWVTLVATYEAEDDCEAFDLMMQDIDQRDGMEISSHTILEEEK